MYGFQIAGVGVTVVFMALLVIGGVVGLFPFLDSMIQDQVKPQSKPLQTNSAVKPKTVLPSPETTSDQIPPEIVAAITAAISVATDKRFSIKSIRYRRTPAETSSWALQGRATIMASHAIKPQTK